MKLEKTLVIKTSFYLCYRHLRVCRVLILPALNRKLQDLIVKFDFAHHFFVHLYCLFSSETDQYEFVLLVM